MSEAKAILGSPEDGQGIPRGGGRSGVPRPGPTPGLALSPPILWVPGPAGHSGQESSLRPAGQDCNQEHNRSLWSHSLFIFANTGRQTGQRGTDYAG